ncbi:copper amine oxidase N-terminal domain-containing protein [Paenibacillus glufosinatiresistens]|uniref:copper amine oxidase N-terminal domain-containing protein n=1 Tax=Paenibacillus glufosinatiresistens TaxID=3070657 RepID=UPI00286E611A|nr:copper amine oxidase N-terminal domain-containing protein [Paenibacillus sp. YX.27]
MMKKTQAALAALLLSGAIALPAGAAPAAPILIQVDGQLLELAGRNPVESNGTVFVPLRPVLQKLGIQVTYDLATGAIRGSKGTQTFKLQIGSTQGTVNGQVRELAAAPRSIKGAVYVPASFISETWGGRVEWDAEDRAVLITSADTAKAEPEMKAFFEKYAGAVNRYDFDAILSLFVPGSDLARSLTEKREQVTANGQQLKLEQAHIVRAEANEIIVHTIEYTHITSGPFKPDSRSENTYRIVRQGDQGWAIANAQITGIQYLVSDEQLQASVTVPEADQKAIAQQLKANFDAANAEDLTAFLATVDASSADLEQMKQKYSDLFRTYDLTYSLETAKIISYDGTNAAVYAIQTAKKRKGPAFEDNRAATVTTVKKNAAGEWKLLQTYVLDAEKL